MGNALGQQFDKGRELFDARRFREAAVLFEREFRRMAAERTLMSEDGVTLCQFLGLALDAMGDYARAAEVWERRRATQEEVLQLHDGRGLSLTIEMLGRALLWSGAVEGALVVLERAVRVKQQEDPRSLAQAMFDLAFARFFGGARDQAVAVMTDCHRVRLSLGTTKETLPELLCAKYALWSFPEQGRDAQLLEECQKLWTAIGKEAIVLLIRKNLLQLAVGLSRRESAPERAVAVGEYCLLLTVTCEPGDSLLRAEVLNVLGIVHTGKAPQQACKTLREAVELLRRLKELDAPLGVRARVDLVNAMVAAGESAAKAVALSEECLAAVAKARPALSFVCFCLTLCLSQGDGAARAGSGGARGGPAQERQRREGGRSGGGARGAAGAAAAGGAAQHSREDPRAERQQGA